MLKYLEYHDDKSAKFWKVTVADTLMTTRWGAIGSTGQSKEKLFGTSEEALAGAEKLIAQKIHKGYAPLAADQQPTKMTPPQPERTVDADVIERISDYEVLRDRWAFQSFPDTDEDEFEDKLKLLIGETLNHSKDFSPQIRAEIIENIFEFCDQHLRYYTDRYFQLYVKKPKKQLFSAVLDLLKPGFDGEEITIDLLRYALNMEILDAIFRAGINPNSEFQSGIESFEYLDRPNFFDRFLDAGANPNLLVEGVIRSVLLEYKYLKKIYKKGVNLNVVDNEGNTPFFCESWDFTINSMRLLKKAGCDIDYVNPDGETALSTALKVACEDNYLSKECSDLITVGACIHCPPNPVPLLMRLPKDNIAKEVLEFIDLLVKKKVSLDERDPQTGNTALHYWAKTNGKISRKVCEKLIRLGADLNSLNNAGQTPLMYAAQQHAEKSWKLLLSKKADIHARSANGYSVSEWSVVRGKEPPQAFLQLLLDAGAPLDGSETGSDLSLLGFLIQNNHYHSALMVIEHGGKITDWVIDSMIKQSQETQKIILKVIAAFIFSVGKRAQIALNTRYKNKIEQLLSENSASSLEDPLVLLSPQSWPPIFPERHQIIVSNVKSKETKSKVLFDQDELNKYLKAVRYCPNDKVLESIKDEKIIERIENQDRRKGIPFDEFSKISDKAMACVWNETICKNQHILSRSYSWDMSISTNEYKYLLARCGDDVVPSFFEIAQKKTNVMIRVMQPVADSRLAPIMAKQFFRTPVSRQVQKWLLRHFQHAVHGLIPIAVGKTGKQRDQCETALRYLASQELTQEILDAAESYDGNVFESIQEILSIDHSFDYHPINLPENQILTAKNKITLPLIQATGAPLNPECLKTLFGMMSLSVFDDVYPPLQKILSLLTPESLAVFSWEVFEAWDKRPYDWREKVKRKKEIEWMYHGLAYMGTDQTVKKLIPLINSWPRWGDMNKAVTGLDIMANISTDYAIRTINTILLKTQYKPLLKRAGEIMDTLCELRGLTKEQLDDRLVPAFGLDDSAALILDFGSRTFTIDINEKMVPSLRDENGEVIKGLPKPNKSDDKVKAKQAMNFWKNLKADLKAEASTQLYRFEQAMLTGRCWSIEDFKTLLVPHPLLCYLVERLIWGRKMESEINTFFRVNGDGSCLNDKDEIIEFESKEQIYLPHPLQMSEKLNVWKICLTQNKLKQPFPQIARQIYLKDEDLDKDFFGIQGAKAPAKAFRGLKAKGWKPKLSDRGGSEGYEKKFGNGNIYISLEGLVTMFDDGIDEDQKVNVTISGKPTNLEFSEAIREIKDLLH